MVGVCIYTGNRAAWCGEKGGGSGSGWGVEKEGRGAV